MNNMPPLVRLLAHHIRTHGPILTARVSSAQARGRAAQYPYWGAVRYEIRLTQSGWPVNRPLERAASDRRSERLAESDRKALCDREGRIPCQVIGRLTEADAAEVLTRLGYGDAVARHEARRPGPVPPRRLTLREQWLVRHCIRAGHSGEEATAWVRRGALARRGQWLLGGAARTRRVAYIPYGDKRDEELFRNERNQQYRRLIIAACGEQIAIAGRTLLQQDDYGRLYREWDGRRIVRVVCPSTQAVYWLPCARYVTTAHQAVAESFGLAADEYHPIVET